MKNLHRNGVFDIEDIRSVVISLYSNGMFLWGIFFTASILKGYSQVKRFLVPVSGMLQMYLYGPYYKGLF